MLSRLLFALFLTLVAAAPVWADSNQELTDDLVLSRINQGRSSESKVTPEDIHLVRPDEFPGVVLVGYRKANSAFLLGTVFVRGELMDPQTGAAAALEHLGWSQSRGEERGELARLWVKHGVLAFGDELLEEEPRGDFGNRDYDTPPFRAPEVRVTPDGSVRMTAWIREAPSQDLGTTYRRTIYLFTSDGRLARTKMLDRFYLPPN